MIYIDDLIGVPYKSGGRDYDGYDCYGYVREICHRGGKELPEVESKGLEGIDLTTKEIEFVKSHLFKIDKPRDELDLVLLKDTKGIMSHIGVYLGNGYFAHCNMYGGHLDKIERFKHIIGAVYSWHK